MCHAVLFGLVVNGAIGQVAHAEPVVAAAEPYVRAVRALERWIDSEVRAKGLPALSIALIDDQRTLWARGFGFADPKRLVEATADTVYRVGSVSKLFTDLAVMQLVEQGRLDLDTPVSQYLPEFAPRNTFNVPITLRQLMSHRSGLVREPPIGHYFDPSQPKLIDVVRSLAETSLVFKPGTQTKYSNAGVAVVGAVVERVRGEPFARAMERSLLEPLGMSRSSFEPGPKLTEQMAAGIMWTYDGQSIATPTFLLGTGPAGNLVSTVNDLGRFASFLLADGRGPRGLLIKSENLKRMTEPQLGKPGESPTFGLGFSLSKFDGHPRIGHSGAVYGFATEFECLPKDKLGAIVITSVDCANGIAQHIAETALRQILAVREGRPLPVLETTNPVPRDQARKLAGRFTRGDASLNFNEQAGKLLLSPFGGGQKVEVRALGKTLIIDDRLTHGPKLTIEDNRAIVAGLSYEKRPVGKPASCPSRWEGLIGEYGWDHDVLYVLEKDGRLHALIEWFFEYPLKEDGPDRFRFPDSGLYAGEGLVFTRDDQGRATKVEAAGVTFRRRPLDGEDGKTFRITPRRPVETIRAEIMTARPPKENGQFRKPDLVELITLDPTLHLDIRYATANNFLGVPVYTTAQAFLQRSAAEALLRAHRSLEKHGYGLLIHDAYRPWQITKLFWEATPDSGRIFVADPSKGSKHNRGAAVDLTLYDRATGLPARMVGGYDEFSPRSNPDYPGGTSQQRWQRDLLRQAIEAEGFTVNEVEWWHFDDRAWREYPILNQRFEDLSAAKEKR